MTNLEAVIIAAIILIIILGVVMLLSVYYSSDKPHRVSLLNMFWSDDVPTEPYSTELRQPYQSRMNSVSLTTNSQLNGYNRYIPQVNRETIALPKKRDNYNRNYEQYDRSYNYDQSYESGYQQGYDRSYKQDYDRSYKQKYVSKYNYENERNSYLDIDPEDEVDGNYQPQEDWVSINEDIDNHSRLSEISGLLHLNGQKQSKYDTILDPSFVFDNGKQNSGYYQSSQYQQGDNHFIFNKH